MDKTGPTINKGKSKQDYATPDDFYHAVEMRFGPMSFDLAADTSNARGEEFFDAGKDSLKQDWAFGKHRNLWLNPPYSNISPWAKKCSENAPFTNIFMLVPASVGSEWYRNYVEPFAYVLALNPRLTFKGCTTPYPKDCILAVYSHGLTGFSSWRWK